MTSPRGPAYLTLPREILAAEAGGEVPVARPIPAAAHPDPASIEQLAGWIAAAERPLMITADAGRMLGGAASLQRLAETHALPVISFNPRYVCLPSDSPMFQGYQPRPLLSEADLVIVLECDVPWIPSIEAPPAGCRVAHIGEDPAYLRYPMRSFPSDLAITSDSITAADALRRALDARGHDRDPKTAARRERLAKRAQTLRTGWDAAAEKGAGAASITPEYLSHAIRAAIGDDAIVVNEYPLRLEQSGFIKPGSYFGLSPAGGLGWGMGAALGAKLAAPDKLVVATLGDGAYVFANPTACHWVAAAHALPILTIVFNNQLYGAVRNSTLSMYGSGAASCDGGRMLADLRPSPDFERLVEASGGHGERVEAPADLPAALARAVKIVTQDKRQALLNVICHY
jgi:acetolactate synthase-1/2/3 large subunit